MDHPTLTLNLSRDSQVIILALLYHMTTVKMISVVLSQRNSSLNLAGWQVRYTMLKGCTQLFVTSTHSTRLNNIQTFHFHMTFVAMWLARWFHTSRVTGFNPISGCGVFFQCMHVTCLDDVKMTSLSWNTFMQF